MQSPTTIAQIKRLLDTLPEKSATSEAAAIERDSVLTKPPGALGRLEDMAVWMSAWQGNHPPAADNILIAIFAGNHGVTAQGVSPYPPEVTVQMVANFQAEGAAVNQLAKTVGARLEVHPILLDQPTADLSTAAAMTEDEFVAAFNVGMESVSSDLDLLCIGEMGIGNTTAAAAVACALFGGCGADWAGAGTGLDENGIDKKADVVDAAMAFHGDALQDPLEALRRVGGRELAAMAGAVLAARLNNVPVLIDGYVACAAVAPLYKVNEEALDHCMAGHVSAEAAAWHLLAELELDPILEMEMRLGEGSGAALAANIIKAAVATHNGMASFAEAGVTDKEA